ncbi:MAG: malate dehydrogenase [Candidatus Omnitrophica bacterium]|nr:malate dehydrogenase [Candidatus Omnitrophota bacterium]
MSIIGAGAVGATLAQRIFESNLADVVLVDILEKVACGKALDLMDGAPIMATERSILGTGDYAAVADSDIVVITAGLARKPGMSREDLISKNAAIVKDVSCQVKRYAPSSIVIVVTNPLDSMAYLVYKTTGFKREKVLGMAGVLDGSRFIALIADDLKVPRASITAMVLGSHGDTMVPVVSKTFVGGEPLTKLMAKDRIESIIKRTCNRGAEIVSCLGTGSAYYSPSAAVFSMVKAILRDTKEIMTVSAYLEGEFGLKDIYIGVPCRIGRAGIEEVLEIDLSDEESSAFHRSAQAIRQSIASHLLC